VIRPASEILLAVVIVSAVLVPTRDSPWLLVFTTLIIILASGLILLVYVFPDIGQTYFSGQGYFGENKIFSTIAEAQAPDYSRAMFSYGVVTTFLALFGILLSVVRVARDLKAHYLFMTIWGITAVYMAISATRFIFNAGPIFAILSGWIIYEFVVRLDFRKMLKHYRSLKGGGRLYAIRKSVKISHVVGVLFLAFMIIIPNVWLGWDAGVPYGHKKEVDVQVYDALPWFLRPPEDTPDGEGIMYNRTNQNDLKYFGAFGHGFPSDYWLDSMRWLSEQDTELPVEDRPAFISWWDYGFWAIYLGEHPTAADNFQGRVQFAGSMISAKGEEEGVALLIARILEADRADYKYKEGHDKFKLHDGVTKILEKYFEPEELSNITDVLINTPNYKSVVLNNPDKYGYYTEDLVPEITPIYAILQKWIPQMLTDEEMTWLYHELQEETDYSLRYFAIDSRLFPFGPQNTGIYYAPLKLSDHRISDSNEPFDFVETIIIGSDNREYSLPDFRNAQERDLDLTAQSFKLKYYEPFLDSMLMKCYIGYTLEDIGATDTSSSDVEPNLPGVHSQNYPPMQGWMMKHFQLVYRTAYWNPYNSTEYTKHQDAWEAVLDQEINDQVNKMENDGIDNDNNGIVDDNGEGGVVTSGLRSGVIYLKYYEGAFLNGTITSSLGNPVPGVRVTVRDVYGIPHDSVLTDENGTYRLLAPSGNITVEASTGGFGEGDAQPFNMLAQKEQTSLNTTTFDVTDDQAMRRQVDEDGDGVWDYIINHDFVLDANSLEGVVFWDMDSDGVYNSNNDTNISSVDIVVHNIHMEENFTQQTDTNGTFEYDDLPPGTYEVTVDLFGHEVPVEFEEPLEFTRGASEKINIPIRPGEFSGNVSALNETRLADVEVRIFDVTNETEMFTRTDSTGNFTIPWLLPGNYTAAVDIVGFEEYEETFQIQEGNTTDLGIVLLPSSKVSGVVTNAQTGLPISNVSIRFNGIEAARGLMKFANSDESGQYSISLRSGKYEVEVKHYSDANTPMVYYGQVDLTQGDVTLDIALLQTTAVYGVVFRDFNNSGSAEPIELRRFADVIFDSSSYKMVTKTNSTAFYKVYLPPGDYNVHITWDTTKETYMQQMTVIGPDAIEKDILMNNGRALRGTVYYDRDQNDDYKEGEELAFSRIVFTDENGTKIEIITDSLGEYNVNLPFGRNYTYSAEEPGFQTNTSAGFINITELVEVGDIKLVPLPISVSGTAREDGNAISGLNISFIAAHPAIGNDEDDTTNGVGAYSVDLIPDDYTVIVDFNTTASGKLERYVFFDTIQIVAGEISRIYDIDLTKLIKINGTVTGTSENVTINFDFDEGFKHEETDSANGSFEVYVKPGEYLVSVDHENSTLVHLRYVRNFTFSESETLILDLVPGVLFNATLYFNGDPVDGAVIELRNNGTVYAQTGPEGNVINKTYLLPNTTYDLVINHTRPTPSGPLIKYEFSDTLIVGATNISSDLLFNITKFVNVYGHVLMDLDNDGSVDPNEGIDNVSVSFEDGMDVITFTTNATGFYEVFLVQDTEYDVNLASDFPILDEGLTVTPTLTVFDFDFDITPENLTVNGTTKHNGTVLPNTTIWFKSDSSTAINKTASSDSEGNFTLELSYGDYEIYARKVSGSEVYVAIGEITVLPRYEDLHLDLDLVPASKVTGLAYHLNSTDQNLSIPVTIEFTDETMVTTYSNSNGQFEVWLPSGSYLTSADYSDTEYDITMNYTYLKRVNIDGDSTLFLNLTKVKLHKSTMEWIEKDDPIVNLSQNQTHVFHVKITNTGNVKDTFFMSHTSAPGWNITYPQNFTLDISQSTEFEVSVGTSEDARVVHDDTELTATSQTSPTSQSNVKIEVNILANYTAGKIELGENASFAKDNTLNYNLRVTNVGNIIDNFTFSTTNIPSDWNVTLTPETRDLLGVGDTQGVEILITIPYNSTIFNRTITFVSTSEEGKVSDFDLDVSIGDLSVDEDDIDIKGQDVSQGKVSDVPIPGFEAIAMIVALIGVAVIMKRRRIQ
jgi:hypothetical protein